MQNTCAGRTPCSRARCVPVRAYRDPPQTRTRTATTSVSPPTSSSSRRDFIEARQVSLFELFDGDYFKFDIPEYQRPYSWRTKQVYELLRDLRTAYAAGQEYFLGAVVATRPDSGAAGAPYQVIDGQQRLTSLVMVLSYVRHWCMQQPAGEALAARLQRMLYLEQDPLDMQSVGRFRLQLRIADQKFFEDNILQQFLPQPYHLSTQLDVPGLTPAAEPLPSGLKHGHNQGTLKGGPLDVMPGTLPDAAAGATKPSRPLNKETWWRIYQSACFVGKQLQLAGDEGVSLPDWVNHMLKCCFVVVMTARDESASFRIFSTLNGRGMDLSVVDKLKADWLQVLGPEQRASYAERWSDLESALGRRSFHRLLDHLQTVQTAGRQQGPQGGSSSSNGNLSSSALLQVPYGVDGDGSGTSSMAAASLLEHFSSCSRDAGAACEVLNLLLDYGHKLLQLRMNDWRQLADEGGTAPAIAAQLEEACFFINLLEDDSWQPWTLHWWHMVSDDEKRVDWLRGAERLQLYCELRGDPEFKQQRWIAVGRELLQRPFYSDRVLDVLALTDAEQEDMLTRLGCRDLAAEVEDATLIHLLLRADSINRKSISWRRLRVERILPLHPPEGSLWRKQKLLLPAGPGSMLWDPDGDLSLALGGEGRRAPSPSSEQRRSPGASSSSSNGSLLDEGSSSSSGALRKSTGTGSAGARVAAVNGGSSRGSQGKAAADSASSSPGVPAGMREVRYWFEVQRSHWRNRLGNLVLLQPTPQAAETAGGSHLTADIDAKLRYYGACGAEEHFPDFSGGLVTGNYSHDKFSPEECRLRHGDLLARLAERFQLCQW